MPTRTYEVPSALPDDFDSWPLLVGLARYGEVTGQSQSATYRAAREGRLGVPVHKVGGRMVVRREDLRRLLLGPSSPSAA